MIIERLMGNLVRLYRLVGGGIYIRAVASNKGNWLYAVSKGDRLALNVKFRY